jgi:hypothetical protein
MSAKYTVPFETWSRNSIWSHWRSEREPAAAHADAACQPFPPHPPYNSSSPPHHADTWGHRLPTPRCQSSEVKHRLQPTRALVALSRDLLAASRRRAGYKRHRPSLRAAALLRWLSATPFTTSESHPPTPASPTSWRRRWG